MTTPPPPPGSGGNQPYDPTGSSPYPGGQPAPGSQPDGPAVPQPPAGSAPSGPPAYPTGGPSQGPSSYPGGPSAGGPSSYPGAAPAPGPGAYGQQPPRGSDSTKVLSLVSMGTGIAGVVLCCCWGLPMFSIIALITGYLAKNQTKGNPRPDLKTFIMTGLITGAIGILIAVVYWVLVATGVIDLNATYSTTGF